MVEDLQQNLKINDEFADSITKQIIRKSIYLSGFPQRWKGDCSTSYKSTIRQFSIVARYFCIILFRRLKHHILRLDMLSDMNRQPIFIVNDDYAEELLLTVIYLDHASLLARRVFHLPQNLPQKTRLFVLRNLIYFSPKMSLIITDFLNLISIKYQSFLAFITSAFIPKNKWLVEFVETEFEVNPAKTLDNSWIHRPIHLPEILYCLMLPPMHPIFHITVPCLLSQKLKIRLLQM